MSVCQKQLIRHVALARQSGPTSRPFSTARACHRKFIFEPRPDTVEIDTTKKADAFMFDAAALDDPVLSEPLSRKGRRAYREGYVKPDYYAEPGMLVYNPPVILNPPHERLIPYSSRQHKRPQPPAKFYSEAQGGLRMIGSDKRIQNVGNNDAAEAAFYDSADDIEKPISWEAKKTDGTEELEPEEGSQAETDTAMPGYLASMTRQAFRWETALPTNTQLEAARSFFTNPTPQFITSSASYSDLPQALGPEVVLLGRSNVGKSSLMNLLLGYKIAKVSSKPGATRLLNLFSVGDGKLTILDSPGYGFKSRPEWGEQMLDYIRGRKQLRRAFILIDSMHGLKQTDRHLMSLLNDHGISYQCVYTKTDKMGGPRSAPSKNLPTPMLRDRFTELRKIMIKLSKEKNEGRSSFLGEILATNGNPGKGPADRIGRTDMAWAMMRAAGLDHGIK